MKFAEKFPAPADQSGRTKKKSREGFLNKLSDSQIVRVARLTAIGADLLIGTEGLEAKTDFKPDYTPKDSLKKESLENSTNLDKQPRPEDYDLSKICKLDLEDLAGKKSLDSTTATKVIQEAIAFDYLCPDSSAFYVLAGNYYGITTYIESEKNE